MTPPMDQQPSGETNKLGRNMPVAIASGLALGGLFIGTLVFSPWALLVFIGALLAIAMAELDKAFQDHGLRPGTPIAMGAGFVMFFGTYASGSSAQTLGLVLLLFGSVTWALLDRERSHMAANLGATMLIAVWVPFMASFAGLILQLDNGRWLLFLAVLLAVCNDIGGFTVGMNFGRHKLAPTVSPAKSWEGFFGGIAFAALVGAIMAATLIDGLAVVEGALLGVGAAMAGTLGDLAESMVKRDLGVKDLGHLIPGHGGIMDRADAIIFSLPMTYLMLAALGLT